MSELTEAEVAWRASAAYERGHYQEAARYHTQAAEMARNTDQGREAFSHAVTAAISWKLAGYPIQGFSELCLQLGSIPADADASEVHMAREQVFRITCDYRPQATVLDQRLQDLRAARTLTPTGQADVDYLEGCLLDVRGQGETALSYFERAIVRRGHGHGFMKFQIMAQAMRCCLRLGRREEAGQWCELLGNTETYFAESQIAWHEACARLALYDLNLHDLEQALHRLSESIQGLQRPTWRRRTEIMVARLALLQEDRHGDPWSPSHPVRRVLSTRSPGAYEVCDRYERRLLMVDYQLASVRYALGLPTQEEYYCQPHSDSGVGAHALSGVRVDMPQRIQATHRALQTADRYARTLDEGYGSTWRVQEIRGRANRLQSVLDTMKGNTHERNFFWSSL